MDKYLSGERIRVVHPLFQEEGGGSIPTSPLQLHIGIIGVYLARELNAYWHARLPVTDLSNLMRNKWCICFGAESDGLFYAAAIWTSPVSRMLDNGSNLELRRMAIAQDAPKNTASRMLKIMRMMLRKEVSGVTRLISYQDTEVHKGTIYKAAGWSAVHESTPSKSGWNTRKRAVMQTTACKVRWEIPL